MKKLGTLCSFIILALTLAMLSGCGAGANRTSDVDLDSLKDAMLSAREDMPKMEHVDSDSVNAEELFTNLSSLEYVKVDEYFYYYSSEGTADELAVIRLKNSSDVKSAESSLKKHIEARIEVLKTYAPDEVDTAKDARIIYHDNIVVMIMSHNADAIEKACNKILK